MLLLWIFYANVPHNFIATQDAGKIACGNKPCDRYVSIKIKKISGYTQLKKFFWAVNHSL